MGGRGLIGATDCHRAECTGLADYVSTARHTDRLVNIVYAVEKVKKHGLISFLSEAKRGTPSIIDREHERKLCVMKLHGNYFEQQNKIPGVDLSLSRRWINCSYFRYETESLLCAGQEQALATNYIRNKVWGTADTHLCRLCKVQNETVQHIVSGCKMLCANQYTFRHNQVAKYIHWTVLRDLDIKVSDSWLKHQPAESVSKDGVTVMWDMFIITDKKVRHNRPDIVIHDRNKRNCILVDVAIPNCYNVVSKEAEKITKYRDLEVEVQKCWNLKTIRTIPVVIGALGTVCKGISEYTKTISPQINFDVMQRTALLGTAHILRNFLTPYKNLPS